MKWPLLNEFLNRYSEKTKRTYQKRFEEFQKFIGSLDIQEISNVKKMHIEEYARKIVEIKLARKDTKDRHYSLIKQYFIYLFENDILKKQLKLNSRWKFSDFIKPEIIERNSKPLPDLQDMKKLLLHAKKANPLMFIFLAILFPNGMRPGECRSIRLENIRNIKTKIRRKGKMEDIEFSYIITGLEKNNQKTGQVIYFLPKRLEKSLEWKLYLKQINYFQEPVYLFQTTQFPPNYISLVGIRRNLKKYGEKLQLGTLVNPHIFRDVLNEIRMEEGCDPVLREILINHSPKGTNAKYYLKKVKQIQNRFDYWEKFTPDILKGII